MTDHADLEALSAFVDGEAPEWAAHVAACPSCGATVDALRAVQAAVAQPLEPAMVAERDRVIAAALAGAPAVERPPGIDEAPPAIPGATRHRHPARWLVPASIAAAVVLVAGATSLLTRTGPSDRATTAAPAGESAPPSSAGSAGAGGLGPSLERGVAALAAPRDLGEVPDAATLLARARPGLATRDAASTIPSTPGPQRPGGGAASGAIGPHPCEAQARGREPALGQTVYLATATVKGVPAVVLGFSTGPAPAPVTLLVLAQEGCGVLLRAAGP